MRMLNLGCGATFHEDWVNIDFTDHGGKVLAYDLRLGIPFADASFDVVYHSHVLEHMPKAWGEFFLQECYRVLRPGGLLRVVVPDLENIARAYVASLDAVRSGEAKASEQHRWMIVELIDQLTRTYSGGEMLNWWKQQPVPQEDFIVRRLGKEAELGMAQVQGQKVQQPHTALPPLDTTFLLGGEKHAWMYDACSLKDVLQQCAFTNITQCAHNESALPFMTQYGLDTTNEGLVRKPDSLFMEAVKGIYVQRDAGLNTGPNIGQDIEPDIGPDAQQHSHCAAKRVTMFSTSDAGGAAIAALRLHNALNKDAPITQKAEQVHLTGQSPKTVHSHMYVAHQHFFQNRVHVLPAQSIKGAAGGVTVDGHQAQKAARRELATYNHGLHTSLTRYPQRPQGLEHFSVPGQCVPFEQVPFLDEADILHFHWIAGLCDPSLCKDYLRGKKIVWTLHDMNAFTGGCHYNNGCRKFEKMCTACPQLGSIQEKDLAFETWRNRMGAYRELDIHVVTPSAWLAEEARKSALLKRFPVHHIPYAQPLDIFQPLPREHIRTQLGFKPNALVLLFASQSLTNTRKGGIYLVQLLHVLAQTPLKERITVIMLGHNTAPEFTHAGIEVQCLGHIDDAQHMAALYNAADAVLVPSLEDNQPNVICESLGCGTPVVAFANGGIAEMIRHEETGYLAESKSVEGLLQGVVWADAMRQNSLIRRICRAHALEQWDAEQGAQRYAALYAQILQKEI